MSDLTPEARVRAALSSLLSPREHDCVMDVSARRGPSDVIEVTVRLDAKGGELAVLRSRVQWIVDTVLADERHTVMLRSTPAEEA